MPEIVIKYKNEKTLELLKDLAKYFDFDIEKKTTIAIKKADRAEENTYPISFAKRPDFMALAGIWKDKEISLVELRKNAWGDRQ